MRCEVCGREIYGKPYTALIEGAKLMVCSECSKHGKIVWEEPKPQVSSPKPKTLRPPPLKIQTNKPQENVTQSMELVEGFDLKIKQAREKLGLSHKDLGKKINEKVSVLKKIELGKMTPDNTLAAKLEHALKIKILVPFSEEKVSQPKLSKPSSAPLTLGDIIKIQQQRKKEEEESQGRKLS